jgi:hypothetical protein
MWINIQRIKTDMIRKLIKKVNQYNQIVSVISLILSTTGLIGFLIWAWDQFQTISLSFQSLSEPSLQITLVGTVLASFVFIRSILQDVEDIFFRDETIITGMGLTSTRYSYRKILDRKCKKIIIVGQNLRTLTQDRTFINHIAQLLNDSENVQVSLIFTKPEILDAMKSHIPHIYQHLIDSVKELKDLYSKLSDSQRSRFFVCLLNNPG